MTDVQCVHTFLEEDNHSKEPQRLFPKTSSCFDGTLALVGHRVLQAIVLPDGAVVGPIRVHRLHHAILGRRLVRHGVSDPIEQRPIRWRSVQRAHHVVDSVDVVLQAVRDGFGVFGDELRDAHDQPVEVRPDLQSLEQVGVAQVVAVGLEIERVVDGVADQGHGFDGAIMVRGRVGEHAQAVCLEVALIHLRGDLDLVRYLWVHRSPQFAAAGNS